MLLQHKINTRAFNFTPIRRQPIVLLILLMVVGIEVSATEYTIYYDQGNEDLNTLAFGVENIKVALSENGNHAVVKDLSELTGKPNHSFVFNLQLETGVESYIFTQAEESFYSCHGGRVGLMYAALELAERIRNDDLNGIGNEWHQPHLEKRGLKMNIPLDARCPSYADFGSAAQHNIKEVWEMQFWKDQLDAMARNRYNCITLWNLQPFPSLVKVPGYDDAHLNDVMVTARDWDQANSDYDTDGTLSYTEEISESLILIKSITIDKKIEFWQEVMKYGYDRGIEFHIYTWNVFVSGAGGANGLPTEYQLEKNPVYRDNWTEFRNNTDGGIHEYERLKNYYYMAVKAMLETYPKLGGFGITAGEGFGDANDRANQEEKEELLAAYGDGVFDYFTSLPKNHQDKNRHISFVHRSHQADESLVFRHFGDLMKLKNVTFDYSTKYANARLHSYSGPGQRKGKYDTKLADCPQGGMYGGKWWLNIRNDDIFTFRWGDYDFVKTFIESININEDGSSINGDTAPLVSIRGFHMGADGYFMGREFLSKKPATPRQLEHDKSWLRFMLWGRLGFDPATSESVFISEAKRRCNIADPETLTTFINTWKTASKIIPAVNKTYYKPIDYLFHPEYNIKDKRGKGRFADYFLNYSSWNNIESAVELDSLAKLVFITLPELRNKNYSEEYRITLDDMEAFAELGSFYADWIRTENETDKAGKEAATHWKKLTQIAMENYTGQILARLSPVSYQELYKNVLQDLSYPEDLNQLPEVRLTLSGYCAKRYPNPYIPVSVDSTFQLHINASDPDGSIEKILIYVNGEKVGSNAAKQEEVILNLSPDFYMLEVRAYDNEGDFGSMYLYIKVT